MDCKQCTACLGKSDLEIAQHEHSQSGASLHQVVVKGALRWWWLGVESNSH